MVYPPDPNELWDPSDDERDIALEEPQRALEESQQYLPVRPPISVDEGSQLWDPEEEFVPTFTVERRQKIRGEGSLESAEQFADMIAAEIKELREKETGWAQRTVRGAKRLPVIGGLLSAGSLWDVYKASERYNQGQFWKGDAKAIAAYMAEAERYGDLGVWDKALEIVLDIPGYGAEIALTGSAMTAGRQLVRKVGTEVAEKMVKRGVLKTVGTAAAGRAVARGAQIATRGVGAAGGLAVGGVAMAARSPWLLAEQVTQYAVQNSLKGEDNAFAKALLQGPLSASITLATEFAGGSTAAMLGRLPGIRTLKKFVATNWLSADKTRTLAGFGKLKDRIGWHGIIGEIEEERWDELLHGLTGLTDDYGAIQGIFSDDQARQSEAWKQIGSETIAFTAFGMPFTVASAAQYRRAGMTARKALEKFAQSDNPSRTQYDRLTEGIRAHMPVEGTPISVEDDEGNTVTEPFDPGKKHHRRAVRKDAQQILNQWDAMAANAPQDYKDRMVAEAEAILAATEDVATQRGAMGAFVDRLLETRGDGEAMLKDGIDLAELRRLRVRVAGVPTNADRTAEELARDYPEAAGLLIESEETVSATLFEKLTGIPNASEKKIGEFGQQVQDIIGAQFMESLGRAETAQQQLSQVEADQAQALSQAQAQARATSPLTAGAPVPAAEPVAAVPGVAAAEGAEPGAAVPAAEPGATGAAAIGGKPGQFGPEAFDTSPASHDAYAQHSQFAIALPELLELAQRLFDGESLVLVEGALERMGKAGEFREATAKRAAHILMNPKYASDAAEAAIILGHEIGHLINYLPHETLKNGNILGRVAGLQKYLKGALAGKIGGREPMTDAEKTVLKKKVRSDLLQQTGKTPTDAEVRAETRERVQAENKKRSVVTANELRAELIRLSEWWTPHGMDLDVEAGRLRAISQEAVKSGKMTQKQADAAFDAGYKKAENYLTYRHSSSELMAQSLSVLLVAPKELQERAPIFWELFGNYISRHPKFLKEYQELQDLLAGDSEELLKHRERRILDNYASGAEALIAAAAARDAARIDGWDAVVRWVTQGILDRTAPGKKLGDEARKILLKKIREKEKREPTDVEMVKINREVETLKNTLDELFTADAPAHAMVLKNQRLVIEPLRKVGITLNDFGIYMEMRRDIMERGELYNPNAHTPETAAEQIDLLRKRLRNNIQDPDNPGQEITQFEYLERMALVWHHEIIHPMVKEAVKAGVYSQATYNNKIAPNVANYATFLVIRHIIGDEISPMIHDQTGTFEAVANPAVATLLKMVKLSRMTVLNRTKGALVDWMNRYFREEIEPVPIPTRLDKETGREIPDTRLLGDPPRGKAHLIVLEDGKNKAYLVDEYLNKVFLNSDLGSLEGITRVMNSVLYRTFHPLFVTYNPSFVAGNWLRDIQRTQRNLGAQGRRLEFETYVAELQAIRDTEGREPTDAEKKTAKEKSSRMRMGLLDILKERHTLMGWGKVAEFFSFGYLKPGPARLFARGEKVELVEQMMAEHAYAVPLTDIESQVGGLLPGFVEEQLSPRERVAKQVEKLRDLEDPKLRDRFMRTVLPAVGRLYQAFELIGAERLARYGAAQELAGKMTGYNLLVERQVPVRERAMITRKDVGTPDFMQRGLVSSITNSLFMYSKVRWSALLRDYQLLKGDMPKTRAAWITHQIIWTLLPTTVTKLAGYGMLASLVPGGDEAEEWYTMFSKYFLDNYDVLPMGYTEIAGKQHAVGITVPRDEMRSFVAQMWGNAMDATLESMTDVETQAGTVPKAFQELAEALYTNMMPNINPYLDIAGTWMAYSQGMNPRDRFYKGDVIPRSNWEAGGWESNRKMLAWTFKKTGVLNTAVHPIAGPILGDAFDDAQETWKTTTLRTTPMLQRFLRVSQRGLQDRRWAAMEEERGDSARFRLQLPTTVRQANGEQYLMSHTQHLLDDEGKQKLLVLNKWRSMTYMPAREKMLEATAAGDEQTFNQLREQLSTVTQEIMAAPISETPPLYLGAVAWSLTDPSFEKPGESSELKLLKVNRIDLGTVESLIRSEALRRNNMEIQRRSKRIGREIRTRQFPKYTRALAQRITRVRDIFAGRKPRRRIGRVGERR